MIREFYLNLVKVFYIKKLFKRILRIKKLKKEETNESDRTLDLFKEYTEKYPDKTYSDFLKMKRGKKNEK